MADVNIMREIVIQMKERKDAASLNSLVCYLETYFGMTYINYKLLPTMISTNYGHEQPNLITLILRTEKIKSYSAYIYHYKK